MLNIKIDKTEFDQYIRARPFKTMKAVERAIRSAATGIRSAILKELSVLTKIKRKDLNKRVRKKVKFGGGEASITITTKFVEWNELGPVETNAGVMFFNPLAGTRTVAKRDPKTFIVEKRRGRIHYRKKESRYPIRVLKRIPLSDVWKKRVGNRFDRRFQEIFNDRMKKQLEKSL